MDFVEMFTNKDQFVDSNSFQPDDELHKKILRDGDNWFRIVGKGKIFWIHQFDSANGKRVRSICTKDEDGNGECEICKIYKEAWAKINEDKKAKDNGQPSPYDAKELDEARIIAGEIANPKLGWKMSWGAKRQIAMNVIDKDSKVNAKENHTSLLCKTAYDKGISASRRGIYENIVKLLTRHRVEIKEHYSKGHDWLPFDINLIKEGKRLDTTYDKERGETSPLTEKELAYERYNLDALLKPTNADIVHKWLTKGTGRKVNPNEDANTKTEAPEEDNDQDLIPPEKKLFSSPEPKKEKKKVEPPKEEPKPKSTLKPKVEPKKEEPAPQVKATNEEMDNCPTCDKLIPVTSLKCPFCGCEFEGHDEVDNIPY